MSDASRTITTRLRLEGESEYSAQLKNVSSRMRELRSELALAASEYDGQANTYEALSKKGEILARIYEEQQNKVSTLTKKLEELREKQAAFAKASDETETKLSEEQAKLEEMRGTVDESSKAFINQVKAVEDLKKALAQSNEGFQKAENSIRDTTISLNYANKDLKEFGREIDANNGYLDETGRVAGGVAKSIDEYGKAVKKAADNSKDLGDKGTDAINALASALAAAGIKRTIDEIAGALLDCVKSSVEFESAMAGVFKTVDGTDAQLAQITDGIKEMSTVIPLSAKELAAIAESAGQLGIATDDVLSFTEVMAKLGTSTNMTSEQAATMLAQFANVTGLDPSMYENLGSAIVALGNNSATTESKIVEMSQRIASAGTLAGMSETDILGVSAALSSLGIEAEAGGSAMAKIITQMQLAVETGEGLEDFAEAAGMSASEFSKLWGTNAVGALDAFIKGLANTERSGKTALAVLSDMEITEVRLTRALTSLATSGNLLTDSVNLSNRAWQDNAALSTEAATRYETTESKMQLLNNSVDLLKTAIGDQLNPALGNLAEAGAGAAQWAAEFIQQNEWLVPVIAAVTSALEVLAVAIVGFTVLQKIIPLIQAFNAALANNPIGLVAVAIGTLVTALGTLAATFPRAETEAEKLNKQLKESQEASDEARKAYEETSAAINQSADDAADMTRRVQELAEKTNRTAAETEIMLGLISDLNESVPNLNLSYDELNGTLTMTAEAILAVIAAQREQDQYNEDKERLIALDNKRIDLLEKQKTAQEEFTAARKAFLEFNEANPDAALNFEMGYVTTNDDAYRELSDNAKLTEENLILVNQQLQTNAQELEAAKNAVDKWSAASEAAAEASGNQAESIRTVVDEMKALEEEYNAAYEAARKSIDGQIGLWQTMDNTAETGADTLNGALLSQIEYLSQYSDNMTSLLGRNVEGVEDFAKNFADGSADSAAALAGLAAASDEEIAQIIENMKRVEEGKDAWAESMAELEVDFDKRMTLIEARLEMSVGTLKKAPEAAKAGADTLQGYINGIEAKEGALYSKMRGVAAKALDEFKAAIDQHSPSRAYMKAGGDTLEGYMLGLEEKRPELIRQMQETAREALDAFAGEFKDFKATADFALSIGAIDERQFNALMQDSLERFNLAETDQAAYQSIAQSLAQGMSQTYEENITAALEEVKAGFLSLEEAAEIFGVNLEDIAERHSLAKAYDQQMSTAVAAVIKGGMSIAEAVKKYGVSYGELKKSLDNYVKDSEKAYDEAHKLLEMSFKEGLLSAEEYYAALARIRDLYLEETSDAHRLANVELYKLQKDIDAQMAAQATSAVPNMLTQTGEFIRAALMDLQKTWDNWLENRKAQIDEELSAEIERQNTIIAGINAEISARREAISLRNAVENADDKQSAAQKKVDEAEKALAAAKAQLKYARDDNERIEAEKLVTQKEEALSAARDALSKAQRDYDEQLWYKQKQDEINAAKAAQEQAAIDAERKKSEAEAAAKSGYAADRAALYKMVADAKEEAKAEAIKAAIPAMAVAAGTFASVAVPAAISNNISNKNAQITFNTNAAIATGQIAALVAKTFDNM